MVDQVLRHGPYKAEITHNTFFEVDGQAFDGFLVNIFRYDEPVDQIFQDYSCDPEETVMAYLAGNEE